MGWKLRMLSQLLDMGRGYALWDIQNSAQFPHQVQDEGMALLKKTTRREEAENKTSNLLLGARVYQKLNNWGGRRYTHVSPAGPSHTSQWLRDRIWNIISIARAEAPRNQYKTWFWNGKHGVNYNTVNQTVVSIEVNKIQKYNKTSTPHKPENYYKIISKL